MSIVKIIHTLKTNAWLGFLDTEYVDNIKNTTSQICSLQGKKKTMHILKKSNVSIAGKIVGITHLKTLSKQNFLENEARKTAYKNEKSSRKSKHN